MVSPVQTVIRGWNKFPYFGDALSSSTEIQCPPGTRQCLEREEFSTVIWVKAHGDWIPTAMVSHQTYDIPGMERAAVEYPSQVHLGAQG
jgi:hypothetical protein